MSCTETNGDSRWFKCHAQRLMAILGGSKCQAQSNDDSRWFKMSCTE